MIRHITWAMILLAGVSCTDTVHESMRQWSLNSKQELDYQESLLNEVKNDVPYERMKLMQRFGSYRQGLLDTREGLEREGSIGIQSFTDEELDSLHILTSDEKRTLFRQVDSYVREYIKAMEVDTLIVDRTYLTDTMAVGVRYNMILQAEIELANTTLGTFYE